MRIFLADGQDLKTETIRNSGKQEKCILGFSCFPEFLIDLLPPMNPPEACQSQSMLNLPGE
jgi:hypothetical protein